MCATCLTSVGAMYETATLLGGPVVYGVGRRLRRHFGTPAPTYAEVHWDEPAAAAPAATAVSVARPASVPILHGQTAWLGP
jgi:hypothetical protein